VISASCVVSAAGRALAHHHAVFFDAACAAQTAVRAFAYATESVCVGGALTIAQSHRHDRNQERAYRCPTRHAYCPARAVGLALTAAYIIPRDTRVKAQLKSAVKA
jgi:hypothetical protein